MSTIKSYYMVLMSEFANMVHTVLPYFRTSKKGVLARGTGSTRLAERVVLDMGCPIHRCILRPSTMVRASAAKTATLHTFAGYKIT